jgi:hypothetical protein
MGEKRNVYRILVEDSEGKRSIVTPEARLEENIIMCPEEMGLWGGFIESCRR